VVGKEAIVAYLEASITYAAPSLVVAHRLEPPRSADHVFRFAAANRGGGGVVYHSYNLYGQMVVYARMNGVVPRSSQR
jgi:hypothetical protein